MNTEPGAEQPREVLSILVADDEPLVRRSLRALLESAGLAVREASAAGEALENIRARRPSLVIADINMPGNDDLALVRTIAEKFPGLPVILLTAFPSVETAVASVNLSVAAYLVKPPNANEVLAAVRGAIGQYEAREAVARSLARLDDWTRDLQRLEGLMNNVRAAADANSTGTFLEISIRHVMTSLLDLREIVSVLAATPSGAESVRSVELSRALQDTIDVLEKTRRVFKSKDLGELRQKLEAVLSAAGGGHSHP